MAPRCTDRAGIPPILLLMISTLLTLPALYGFLTRHAEMISLLEALRQPHPPLQSRWNDPAFRDAAETYLAGRYRDVLRSDSFWRSPIMQGLPDFRDMAAEILRRHPSVSPEDLARVTAIIAPEIDRMKGRRRASPAGLAGVAAIIVSKLAALSVLFVMACSVASSLIAPGGVLTRVLGLAVVTHDGTEITRLRSFARTLVIWAPAIIWLISLAAAPKIQRWVPAPESPVLGVAFVIGILTLGAVWTLIQPERGLHDRLTGVWIVPR